MSGHSKFANIKHKKEKNDAAKGKVFTMIGREIAVAVKEGGPDPANNFKLAQVIAKAKANNMPNDTIDRGIKKAAGDGNSVNYETATYEGYGPSGTAIIVKCNACIMITSNKSDTIALLCLRNVCDINHKLIHADSSTDWCFFPVDQHIALIRKASCISITVSNRNRCNSALLVCHINATVADLSTSFQILDEHNMTLQ